MKKLKLNNTILKFTLRSTVLYIGIIVLTSFFELDQQYSDYAIKTSNSLSGSFMSSNQVKFIFDSSEKLNTKIMVKENGRWLSSRIDFALMGYKSTVVLFVLILSSVIPMKRKLWSLLWGFLMISLVIYFLIYIGVKWTHVEGCEALNLTVNDTSAKIIDFLYKKVVSNGLSAYTIPSILWLGLIFISGDWKAFLYNGVKEVEK